MYFEKIHLDYQKHFLYMTMTWKDQNNKIKEINNYKIFSRPIEIFTNQDANFVLSYP